MQFHFSSTWLSFVAIVASSNLLAQQASHQVALRHVQQNGARFGLSAADVQDLVVKDSYTSAHNGVTHTYLRQRWQGVEVFNGDIAVHVAPNGDVIAANSNAIKGMDERAPEAEPVIGPDVALAKTLTKYLPKVRVPNAVGEDPELHRFTYDGARFNGEGPFVQLHYLAIGKQVRLVWNVNFYQPDASHWWNVRVDALSGKELERNDWVAQCAFDHPEGGCRALHPAPLAPAPAAPNDYNVYAWPLESPSHGPRTLENAPWNDALNASPFGWHDTDGAAGAEYTITRGNNVHAQEDRNGDNGTGYSPDGTVDLDFDFPIDFADEPIDYEDAAITNLFYWNNIVHDVLYQYGFDEVSGNFQENNYGNGGAGNDYVFADAQDGSGSNNANFGTPPDGSNPRMQMFLWTAPTPDLDGDLDNGIVAHEYGHGWSNRLVGGPSNVSCLGNAEQMGEGWSDYLSLIFTMEPGDAGPDGRGIGTYALNQPVTGPGIRPSPYSTDFAVNNYTYGATNSGLSQPHGIGFVWCTILWDMTWDLIDQYGFDPDLYNGTGGNNIALQLVSDGLKLTACQPGFVDGRDAILEADKINNGGANLQLLWAAFARRGLGVSADQGSSSSRSDQVEAFDVPLEIDVRVKEFISPTEGVILDCMNGAMPVTVTLENFGLTDQNNIPISYQLDNDPAVNETYATLLERCTEVQYTFTPMINITTPGLHTLKAWTALPTDQQTSNDTATIILDLVVTTPLMGTISEDFEGETACNTGSDCGATVCPLTGNWSNAANGAADDIDWRVDAGGTPSGGTGPSIDHAPGTSSGNYVYLEASNGCSLQTAYLTSACVDLSAATAPELSFWYHMWGADQGSLHVDVFTGGSWVNDVITPITGDQGNTWQQQIVSLVPYLGQTIVLRIRGITGPDFASDIALDDILLGEPPACPRVSAVAPVELPGGDVRLDWDCAGCSDSFYVEYGPVGFTPGTDANAGGGTVAMAADTFLVLSGVPTCVRQDVYVRRDCGVDGFSFNSFVESFLAQGTVVAPFAQNFDGFPAANGTVNCGGVDNVEQCWTNGTNDSNDWTARSVATGSTGTGPGTDESGSGNYLFAEASGACGTATAELFSPQMDVTALTTPELLFHYHMWGADMGTLDVHVSTDGGASFDPAAVWTLAGDQGDQWFQARIPLPAIAGEDDVMFRWTATGGGGFLSDIAIDEVVVDEAPTCPAPSLLSVDQVFSDQAVVSWNCGGCQGITVIEYGPVGFVLGTGTVINGAATPQPLTGLNSATEYDVYAWEDCGGGDVSTVSIPVTFTTLPECGDQWFDTGGANSNYDNNENFRFTLCPDLPGDVVTATFNSMNIEATWDAIYVYDGPDTSAIKISSGNPPPSANNVYGDGGYWGTTVPGPFTSTHPSGCLTFAFTSDGSVTEDGWDVTFTCDPAGVQVMLSALLQGPFSDVDNAMHDSLRTLSLIPSTEPHTALGFTQVGSGGETVDAGVLANNAPDNAVVDWVLVELRDPIDPTVVVATANALVQRDGDVVATDGVSPVTLPIGPGNYHVALRHRNHLGVMTATELSLTATSTTIDFTDPATGTFGIDPMQNVNGTMVLWSGNVLIDGVLQYTGPGNDRDPILQAIGGSLPTAVLSGYHQEDGNMDGEVRYTGPGNDRDPILVNIGGSIPTATRNEQLP